jgi:drug/metabolite transporter (DMT)-like permease
MARSESSPVAPGRSIPSRYPGELLLISALAAGIFPLIKVALNDFEPVVIGCVRSLLAVIPLFALTCWRVGGVRRGYEAVRACGTHGVFMGFLNYTGPILLISWAEKHIDSGVAAIITATTPLFAAMLAIRFMPSERVTGLRLAGLLLGLVGVGVLTGVHPNGGWLAIAASVVTLAASALYAVGSLYGQWGTVSASMRSDALSTIAALSSGVVLLPLAVLQRPDSTPATGSILALLGLTIVGPIVSQPLFYRMLRVYGATLTNLLTYLVPPIALFYGAVFLGENVTLAAVLGLLLIMAGVALGSGMSRSPRASPP